MARPTNPYAQPVVSPLIPPGGWGERYFRGDCRGNADNSLKHCGQCRVIGRKLRRVFFDRRHSRVGSLDGAGRKRFGVPGRIEIAVRAAGASVQPRTRTSGVEGGNSRMRLRSVESLFPARIQPAIVYQTGRNISSGSGRAGTQTPSARRMAQGA